MSDLYRDKYLKYKNKYLRYSKKLIGGTIDTEIIDLTLKSLKLNNQIQDLFDFGSYTIEEFLKLDDEDGQSRRVGILKNEFGNSLFPLYIDRYNYEIKNNEELFFECNEGNYDFAVQISSKDLKNKKELYRIDNFGQALFIYLDSLKYIRDHPKNKIWLFDQIGNIDRIVNRGYVYDSKLVYDKTLKMEVIKNVNQDGNIVNDPQNGQSTTEGYGRTKCTFNTNFKYKIQRVNLLPDVLSGPADQHVLLRRSDELSGPADQHVLSRRSDELSGPAEQQEKIRINEEYKKEILKVILKFGYIESDIVINTFINDFFRLNSEREFINSLNIINENKNLIFDIILFIEYHLNKKKDLPNYRNIIFNL